MLERPTSQSIGLVACTTPSGVRQVVSVMSTMSYSPFLSSSGSQDLIFFLHGATDVILNRYHPRVLYIDIDIHHGDGVELAFYQSNRVMTVSFHKYTGEFFPGTGKVDDNGSGPGKYFCINVPLQDGIDDEMYLTVFKTVIDDTVTAFRPTSIVLQCGADSLGCDRLGAFNLSIAAHGECVNFVRKYGVPLLVLGGGGYTIKNVSRCWTYETSVLVGAEVPDELPRTVYDAFFADSHWKLHPPLTGKVDNQNTASSLKRITMTIRNKLRFLQGAPSVAMQEIPPDLQGLLDDEERNAEEHDEEKGTGRAGESRNDQHTGRAELYDGDDDNDVDDILPPSRTRSLGRGKSRVRASRTRGRTAAEADTSVTSTPIVEESEVIIAPSALPRNRGKGRGRGRGKGRIRRGRGGSSIAKEKAAQSIPTILVSEDTAPVEDPETLVDIATPSDMATGRDTSKGSPDADKIMDIDGDDSDMIIDDDDQPLLQLAQ